MRLSSQILLQIGERIFFFDWENIFALTGFSGPYVQYSAVRVNNILRKEQNFEIVDFEKL